MTTKDEALKALHEASLSIACLGADWTEHFEDESVTKNHKKWVLKDQEGLQKDIDHIQDQITILENYLDPYNPKEESKWVIQLMIKFLKIFRKKYKKIIQIYLKKINNN